MRTVFFGTPALAVSYLAALESAGHELVAVVTQPDRPAGRGRQLRPSAVKQAALQRGLRVLDPGSAASAEFIEAIAKLRPEVCVVVAYGQILTAALLAIPSTAFINVHYSLLPELRGAAPVYGALRQGRTHTGVTIQHLAEQLDAGDIILQREMQIRPGDNCGTLTDRLTELGVALLCEGLELLARGQAPRIPQEHSRASYVGRVRAEDCRICWSAPGEQIRNQVRACTPWPGAWCLVGGRRLRVLEVTPVQIPLSQGGVQGSIVEFTGDGDPVVLTGRGALAVRSVQPAGKRPMSAAAFLRGARLQAGDPFE